MPLNENMKKALSSIVAKSNDFGVSYANPGNTIVKSLASQGYVTVNNDEMNPEDTIQRAVRLNDVAYTELGLDVPGKSETVEAVEPAHVAGNDDPSDEGTEAAAKPSGKGSRGPRPVPVIKSSDVMMPMPLVTRAGGGGAAEVYPFRSLEEPVWNEENEIYVYDTFFVEATEVMPKPARTLAGTISGANKRFKTEGRKFTVVHMENDPTFKVPGARVYRVDSTLDK